MYHVKKAVHLAKLLAPYKGKWVTLSHDRRTIVGVGVTMDIALQKAKEKGEDHPLLVKSPDKHTPALL